MLKIMLNLQYFKMSDNVRISVLNMFLWKKTVRAIIRLNVIIFIKIVLKFVNSIEIVLLRSSENNIFQNAGNNSIKIVLNFVNSIEIVLLQSSVK